MNLDGSSTRISKGEWAAASRSAPRVSALFRSHLISFRTKALSLESELTPNLWTAAEHTARVASSTRGDPARPRPRLLELGAIFSSALASEAVCLNAMRILAGRDRGDERQNHNDNPGHRCRLSVHE
jgi:hypothetical protein